MNFDVGLCGRLVAPKCNFVEDGSKDRPPRTVRYELAWTAIVTPLARQISLAVVLAISCRSTRDAS